jgi:hypothetical protein
LASTTRAAGGHDLCAVKHLQPVQDQCEHQKTLLSSAVNPSMWTLEAGMLRTVKHPTEKEE